MPNRLVKTGNIHYVPAVEAIPAREAYCTTIGPTIKEQQKAREVRQLKSSSGAGSSTPIPIGIEVDAITGESRVIYGTAKKAKGVKDNYEQPLIPPQIVCFPADPGRAGMPAQTIYENFSGWNAGARSIDAFRCDGFVRFRVPLTPIGVVVGLANDDESTSFAEATHAIYAHGTTIAVVESGKVVATAPVAPGALPLITIVRVATVVTYHVDDWSYTSLKTSAGTVCLDAALYSAGDFVDSPSIGDIEQLAGIGAEASGSARTPAFVGVGADDGGYAFGLAQTPRWAPDMALPTCELPGPAFGSAVVRFHGRGGDDVVGGAAVAPLFVATGDGGFPQTTLVYGGAMVPPILGAGVLLSGTRATGSATISFAGVGSDHAYVGGRGDTPPWVGLGFEAPLPGSYGVWETLALSDFVAIQPVTFIVVHDGLALGDSATIVQLYEQTVFDGLLLGDNASVTQIIEMMVRDGLALSDSLATDRQAFQYAVNIATGALTAYSNFDFLGFVEAGGASYGYRPDGLYRIGDATDDGELLEALLDLGAVDPGTNLKQRMEGAYLGLSTDGEAFMRLVGDDGQEWTYRIEQRPAAAKAKFGRGLQSREWRVSIHLVDASEVDLQSIEFLVYTAVRRWKR